MTQKKLIPHVNEAEDAADLLAGMKLALEQAEHGHYRFSQLRQESLPDGGVRISFERHETTPDDGAEPHGLWDDTSPAAEPAIPLHPDHA